MSVLLGIGAKPPREEAPPPYEGPKAAAEPMEEAAESEGACPITCPKCGEGFSVQVTPMSEAEPEEAEAAEMEEAG